MISSKNFNLASAAELDLVEASVATVDAEVDVTSSVFHAPAGIGSTAASSIAIVPDASASSLASTTDSATVRIGHGASPGTATSQAVSVLIGRGVAHDSNCNSSVVIGADTANQGGSFTGSVIVGYNSMKSTATCNNAIVIGGSSGPNGASAYSRVIVVGQGVQETVADYGGTTGAFTFASDDVVIGSSASAAQQPLIHGSNSTSGRHWSPGAPADLGTTSRPWTSLHLSSSASLSSSGASGMYDFCEVFAASDSSNYTDGTAQLLSLSSTNTSPALGNMTISNTGGYTTIQNTSGSTRRWLITANLMVYASLTGSDLMIGQNWVMISSTRGASATTNYYAHTRGGSDQFSELIKSSASVVVEIADDDYVHFCGFGDTNDGSTWKTFGGTWGSALCISASIAELPM